MVHLSPWTFLLLKICTPLKRLEFGQNRGCILKMCAASNEATSFNLPKCNCLVMGLPANLAAKAEILKAHLLGAEDCDVQLPSAPWSKRFTGRMTETMIC